MLQPREQLPHFRVTDTDGAAFDYGQIWQRQHLLLVLVDGADDTGARRYAERLRERMPELTAHDTTAVVTSHPVAGAPTPGIVIADRWGDVWYVHEASSNAELPEPAELVEWLRYVQMQCPECQGETR